MIEWDKHKNGGWESRPSNWSPYAYHAHLSGGKTDICIYQAGGDQSKVEDCAYLPLGIAAELIRQPGGRWVWDSVDEKIHVSISSTNTPEGVCIKFLWVDDSRVGRAHILVHLPLAVVEDLLQQADEPENAMVERKNIYLINLDSIDAWYAGGREKPGLWATHNLSEAVERGSRVGGEVFEYVPKGWIMRAK